MVPISEVEMVILHYLLGILATINMVLRGVQVGVLAWMIVGHAAYFAHAYFTINFAATIAHFSWQPHDSETNGANSFLDEFLLRVILDHSLILINTDLIKLPVKEVTEILFNPHI
jgi:hypothetical protein